MSCCGRFSLDFVLLFFENMFQIEQNCFNFVAIGSRLFHVVLGCCRLLYNVSFVFGSATLLGFFKLFFVVNCVSMFWGCSDCVCLLWTVLGCLGCLRLFRLFWAALGCVGCLGLFGVAFGCSLIIHAVSSCFELFRLSGCFRPCLVVSSWLP